MLGCNCCGCNLYIAGIVYSQGKIPRNDRDIHADVHQFIAWRYSWYIVPHSFPQVFCKGEAWRIPIPRGYSKYTGACVGREGRQPGEASAHRRSHWWSVRLYRCYIRLVERERDNTHSRLGRGGCRQGKGGAQDQYRCRCAWSWMYHRSQVCYHHLRGFTPRMVGNCSRNGIDIRRSGAEYVEPCHH